jgi:hypothetical protein
MAVSNKTLLMDADIWPYSFPTKYSSFEAGRVPALQD